MYLKEGEKQIITDLYRAGARKLNRWRVGWEVTLVSLGQKRSYYATVEKRVFKYFQNQQ